MAVDDVAAAGLRRRDRRGCRGLVPGRAGCRGRRLHPAVAAVAHHRAGDRPGGSPRSRLGLVWWSRESLFGHSVDVALQGVSALVLASAAVTWARSGGAATPGRTAATAVVPTLAFLGLAPAPCRQRASLPVRSERRLGAQPWHLGHRPRGRARARRCSPDRHTLAGREITADAPTMTYNATVHSWGLWARTRRGGSDHRRRSRSQPRLRQSSAHPDSARPRDDRESRSSPNQRLPVTAGARDCPANRAACHLSWWSEASADAGVRAPPRGSETSGVICGQGAERRQGWRAVLGLKRITLWSRP